MPADTATDAASSFTPRIAEADLWPRFADELAAHIKLVVLAHDA